MEVVQPLPIEQGNGREASRRSRALRASSVDCRSELGALEHHARPSASHVAS